MKLNIGKMTKAEDTKMYQLRRDGQYRYYLSYVPEGYLYEDPFFEANLFEDVMNKIAEHYQKKIADDVSELTNINTGDVYRIEDFCGEGEYRNEPAVLDINVSDLHKISFLLPLLGYGKKATRKSSKKGSQE